MSWRWNLKTAAYAMVVSDNAILADDTNGSFNITLPQIISNKYLSCVIKRIGTNALNSVTVLASGTDKIEGASSISLNLAFQSITLASIPGTGTWYVVSKT